MFRFLRPSLTAFSSKIWKISWSLGLCLYTKNWLTLDESCFDSFNRSIYLRWLLCFWNQELLQIFLASNLLQNRNGFNLNQIFKYDNHLLLSPLIELLWFWGSHWDQPRKHCRRCYSTFNRSFLTEDSGFQVYKATEGWAAWQWTIYMCFLSIPPALACFRTKDTSGTGGKVF